MRHVASPKDRKYLESLNLKALQKSRPKGDQDPKEYYKGLQDEAKSGPLFNDKVLDTVEHLPDLPKPVSKWLGNMDDKELHKVSAQDLRLIIDWVRGSDDTDLDGLSWEEAMEAQKLWHDQLHDNKEDCGEYQTHKVVFSTGGYEFVELKTDHDLKVEGCKLKHCVGGDNYCDAVKNKHSRIISMRNSKNEPQVTIEYRVDDKTVEQCYGYKNHPPARKLNEPLVKFFEHMKWYDGIFLLKNYTVPEDKLKVILGKAGRSFRSRTAKESDNVSVLDWLAQDRDVEIRLTVARRYNVPEVVLEKLTQDRDVDVRRTVVRNTGVSNRILEVLSQDKDASVRHAVASNYRTSNTTLEKLARDSDENIREAVATNNSTSSGVLDILAQDTHEFVRVSVARNYNTAADTLEKLAQDVSNMVRAQVAKHHNLPVSAIDGLLVDANTYTKAAIADKPKTPEGILAKLADDSEAYVRGTVAGNRRTPAKVLDKLSRDVEAEVRYAVAKNYNTQPRTLTRLAQDKDHMVRYHVANNMNTPASVLDKIARSMYPGIRSSVAYNQNAEPSTLEKLSNDREWQIRSAVTGNRNTTVEVLQKLAQDKDRNVARDAEKALKDRNKKAATVRKTAQTLRGIL